MDYRGELIRPKLTYINDEFKENVTLKLDANGKIEQIFEDENEVPKNVEVIELESEALLPGFINSHSHAFHRELRGRSGIGSADTDSFWKWRDNMYKLVAEANFDKIKKYCVATFTEMLQAGITCVGEFHYVHHGKEKFDLDMAVVEAAKETGIRLVLLETLYCRSGFKENDVNHGQLRFKSNVEEFMEHVKKMKEKVGMEKGVTLGVAAHSLRAVPVDQLKRLYEFAREENLPFHLHLEEQPKEIEDCEEVECCTPSELLLSSLPDADQRLTAVHCTYTKRKNLNIFAQKHINICVCPLTEGFLGDGVPNLESNDQLCIGSDCNNRLCFWEEMRWLAYAQNTKTNTRNAANLDAQKLFQIATQNGAISLGLDGKVGKIQPQFQADFITIDLNLRGLVGLAPDQLLDALIFGYGNEVIKRVIVGGIERK